jgi:5-methylcytosine-specific restriction endonuclease McrA
MAATPEAPMSLLVMMLKYVDRLREDLRAQRAPETRPDPGQEGPAQPEIQPPQLPQPARDLPPPRREVAAPVGERHSRRIPQEVKIAVSARDGGVCRQCGSTEKLQFDHIIPASKGGANTVANIQLLCGRCNRAKAAK